MNRPLRAVAIEPAASAVDIARGVVADLQRQLAEIGAARSNAEATAAPYEQAASNAQSLRQQITGVIAKMLKLGSVDMRSPELNALSQQRVDADRAAQQGALIAPALQSVVDDLDRRSAALFPQFTAAQLALAVAQLEALNAEIAGQLIPAYRLAAEQFFGGAHAKLLAAGIVSCEMAQQLSERYGISVQPLGSPLPDKSIRLHPLGFNITHNGQYNTLQADCSEAIDTAHAEFNQRWAGG